MEQVLRLRDEDRLRVAEGRKAVSEAYHAKALRAAAEALAGRAETFLACRRLVAGAHVPDMLADEGGAALRADEVARWNEVARLVQHAIDDALLALLASDVLHPDHLRELYRPWRGVFEPATAEEAEDPASLSDRGAPLPPRRSA